MFEFDSYYLNQSSTINTKNSNANLNTTKKDLNEKMDIFINNAMNMNINPFSSPFDLNSMNQTQTNNNNANDNTNNNL